MMQSNNHNMMWQNNHSINNWRDSVTRLLTRAFH